LKKENIQGKQKRLMLYLREVYHLRTFTFIDCRIFVKKQTETLQVHQISAKNNFILTNKMFQNISKDVSFSFTKSAEMCQFFLTIS
jgi:hypothetical protein